MRPNKRRQRQSRAIPSQRLGSGRSARTSAARLPQSRPALLPQTQRDPQPGGNQTSFTTLRLTLLAVLLAVGVPLVVWGLRQGSKPKQATPLSVALTPSTGQSIAPSNPMLGNILPLYVPTSTSLNSGFATTNSPAPSHRQLSKSEIASQLLNQGSQRLKQENYSEALALFTRAAELDPEDEDVHYNLGITLNNLGRTEEAIQQYKEALRILPEYAEAHNNLGNLLLSQKRLDEAIEHFQAAINASPEYAPAHNNLGTALGLQKKTDEALQQFAEAARLSPTYVEAHFNLANAYFSKGDNANAITEFEQVLHFRPDFEAAQKRLDQARAKLVEAGPRK
jgi:Tfp pilus assembly protein PilF